MGKTLTNDSVRHTQEEKSGIRHVAGFETVGFEMSDYATLIRPTGPGQFRVS